MNPRSASEQAREWAGRLREEADDCGLMAYSDHLRALATLLETLADDNERLRNTLEWRGCEFVSDLTTMTSCEYARRKVPCGTCAALRPKED